MRKITLIFLISLALLGCSEPEVNYNDMFTPPIIKIVDNELNIQCGASNLDSARYVTPHVFIKVNKVYIYGTLTLKKNSHKKLTLPKQNKAWEFIWLNKDKSSRKLDVL